MSDFSGYMVRVDTVMYSSDKEEKSKLIKKIRGGNVSARIGIIDWTELENELSKKQTRETQNKIKNDPIIYENVYSPS